MAVQLILLAVAKLTGALSFLMNLPLFASSEDTTNTYSMSNRVMCSEAKVTARLTAKLRRGVVEGSLQVWQLVSHVGAIWQSLALQKKESPVPEAMPGFKFWDRLGSSAGGLESRRTAQDVC
ncbi:hypothetical protein LXA43DRAFT_531100 [Ganoderma leucocontextum]|nr:hypothetical protein LXA43DRAFT_531100 [Ganoderma leucocontextum]